MSQNPAISIVIPAYNAEKYLTAALASIYKQGFQNYEIILVDDGSTDNTPDICNTQIDPRFKYFRKINSGVIDSIEFGIQKSRAPLIARLDSDDLMLPNRLEKQFELFQRERSLVLVGSNISIINEKGETIGLRQYPKSHSKIQNTLPLYNPFAHPSVCFRKWAYLEAGGLTDTVHDAEDYELWVRLSKLGQTHNIQEPLTAYRIHSRSIKSTRTKKQLKATLEVKKRLKTKYKIPFSPLAQLRLWSESCALLLSGQLIEFLFRKLVYRKAS
jgi:glycosyltransferase involved in cell wall biosynthesis